MPIQDADLKILMMRIKNDLRLYLVLSRSNNPHKKSTLKNVISRLVFNINRAKELKMLK